jgi:hypothetical protein
MAFAAGFGACRHRRRRGRRQLMPSACGWGELSETGRAAVVWRACHPAGIGRNRLRRLQAGRCLAQTCQERVERSRRPTLPQMCQGPRARRTGRRAGPAAASELGALEHAGGPWRTGRHGTLGTTCGHPSSKATLQSAVQVTDGPLHAVASWSGFSLAASRGMNR